MSKLYHYTVAHKLPLILADKSLKPTARHIAPGERQVLWFSTNPVWERTAAKLNGITGERFTFEEHRDRIGLCRFALSKEEARQFVFRDFYLTCFKANTPSEAEQRMLDRGREWGADHNEWYGTFKAVPLRHMTFQVCVEGEKWEDADPNSFVPKANIIDASLA